MASPQETRQLLQEIANRGLVDSIPATKRPLFDEAVRRGLITLPETVDRTFMGQAGEFFRGIPRGAIGLLETAGIGASAMLPDEEEAYLRDLISGAAESASSSFQPKAGYEDSLAGTVGEALGSTVPFVLTGGLPGVAARVASGVALGSASGAGTARTRAEQAGATGEERAQATALGILPGAAEMVAPARILSRLRKPAEGVVKGLEKAAGPKLATNIASRMGRVGVSATEEGLQEAASEIAQNLIAQGIYNPEQGTFTNTGESLGLGAGVGGLVAAIVELGIRDRSAGVTPPPAAGEEQAPPAPPAPPLRTVNIPVSMTGGGENGVMRLVQEPSGKLFSELVDPAGTVRMRQPLNAASPNAFLDEMGKLEVAAKPFDIKTIVDAMAKASTVTRAPEQQGVFDTAEAPVSGAAPKPSLTSEEMDTQARTAEITQLRDALDKATQQKPAIAYLRGRLNAGTPEQRASTKKQLDALEKTKVLSDVQMEAAARRIAALESGAPSGTRQELEDSGQMTLDDARVRARADEAALAAQQKQAGDFFPAELEAATSDDRMVAETMARQQAREENDLALRDEDAEAADSQEQEQLQLDFTPPTEADLTAAGVPKGAPVIKRVAKSKTPAKAKAELDAFAANPLVKSKTAANVKKLVNKISKASLTGKPVVVTTTKTVEKRTLKQQVDDTNKAIDNDIAGLTPSEINAAIEAVAENDGTFIDRPSPGKEKAWLQELRNTNTDRAVNVLNTIRNDKDIPPIELPSVTPVEILPSMLMAGDSVRVGNDLGVVLAVDGSNIKFRSNSATSDKAFNRVPSKSVTFISRPDTTLTSSASKNKDSEFGTEAGKLEADMSGLIAVLGAGMYAANVADVTAKELLQNAFDATKAAVKIGLIKTGEITITLDSNARTLSVSDNARGMTPSIVRDAFFTVAGSDKSDLEPSERSGGLGLAKMGFMLGSERLQLETTRDGMKIEVDATPKEIAGSKFEIKKLPAKPSEHGTVVTVTIPKVYVDPRTGAEKQIWMPYDQNSIAALNQPLIGNVVVKFVKKTSGDDNVTILPIGKNFDEKLTPKLTSATFSWGTADIYFGVERKEYADHKVLSSGVYQFDTTFNISMSERLPFDVIVNIKPNVPAQHPDYPFENSRERFKRRIEDDIKALNAYLVKIARGNEAADLQESFKGIVSMPRLEAGVELADASKKLSKAFDTRSKEAAPYVLPEMPKEIFIGEGSVKNSNGVELATSKPADNKIDATFTADKAAPTAAEFMLAMANDPKLPIFHNNTNVDFLTIGREFGEPEQFFAELGTLVVEMKEAMSTSGQYRYDQLAPENLFFAGISVDKKYGGVHIKIPYKAVLLNPFYDWGAKTLYGVRENLMNTIIHEIAHQGDMDHGVGHNNEMLVVSQNFADTGLIDYFRDALLDILVRHESTFTAMRQAYGRSTTKNTAKSLEDYGKGSASASARSDTDGTGDQLRPVSTRGRQGGSGSNEAGSGLGDAGNQRRRAGTDKSAKSKLAPPAASTPVSQAAESALTNQSPAANNRFLNVQGAQLKKASTPVKAPKFKRAVAAMFDKGQKAVTRAMVWGLGLDQINDYVQSYVKKKGPDYALFAASFDRFTKIADKLEGEMRQFIDGITAQIARMGDWRSSHPDLYEDMNTLVYGGTLGKVDLTKPKGTYAGKPAQLKEYERLEKVLKKLEPSGGAAIYRQMRAIYNRVFNGITQQVYDGVYSATQDADLATTIKNKFTEQMKLRGLEGYAALTRSNGEYRIKYFLPKSDTPYFETFENSADWKARQQQLLTEDGVNKDDMTPFLHGDTSVFDGIVPTSFMGDLVQTLKNKGASDDVLAAVMELGVSVSPAQVVMERLAARKETPGYTLDAFAAFQESVVGLQRKLINMKYSAQMSKEVKDMGATRNNVKTDPTVKLLVDEVRNRAAYAANPNQNMLSNVLTTGTYGWTLGVNVSSAIVDMLSLIVTGGYLSGKFGRRKAHAALVKAGRDILGMGTTADVETMVTQGLDGAALQEAMVTAGIKERDVTRRRVVPSMLNIDFNNPEQAKKYGYLKALVKKVQDHGHSERFSDLEERAEFGESNVVSKVAARMGFMMSTSERYKRETGLKAYYDLALAKEAKNGDPNLATQEQMEKAADEAMEMSRLLNGGSTPVTGPGFQRDNFWRVAFMYRSFAFRQMYVQVKTLYDATLNDDAVVKAAARKFGSTVLLTSGALVGVQGMPLFGPVALLLNVLAAPFVDDEEDEQFVQNMLRSNLDPLVYEGLPNALLNMNVSERGSLTDLLARDTNLPDDASFAEIVAAHLGGPAFGSIERAWRGVGLIEQGEIQRGVESMIPVAMSNVLKSIRFATDGAIETLRDDKVIEISPIAVVSQFMGFTPADYARTMEFKSVQAGVDRRIGERKSNLYATAYTAFRMGDSAGLAQVMQKMIEFNKQYPEEAIRDRDFKQSMRTRARNSAAMMGGTLPRESRRAEWQEAADDWGVEFPE